MTEPDLFPTTPDVLTPQQVATLLGRHHHTVLRWLHSGILRGRKVGGEWFVLKREVIRMLEPKE